MDKKDRPYDLTPPPPSQVSDARSGVSTAQLPADSTAPAWKVGQAKQHLPELLRRVEEGPQVICKRTTPVAALVRYDDFLEFQAWKQQHQKRPLAAIIEGLTAACAEADFTLEIPERRNRPTPFDILAEAEAHKEA